MKACVALAVLIVVQASVAGAVTASTELFLPSVGRGQGACPGGLCSLWRTDVWVFNPGSQAVAVQVAFLERGPSNLNPQTVSVEVGAGATLELVDVMAGLFNLDGAFGALRFEADVEIVVTGRIYDSNVETNLGTGTAGQFFAAIPSRLALAEGDSTSLIGLARDASQIWRTNFGFVETTGQTAQALVELINGDGIVLGEATYTFDGLGTGQVSLADLGGISGDNLRLRATVVAGPGRLLTFASLIDNRTGDPSTVEMVFNEANRTVGSFEGVVLTPDDLRIDGGIELVFTAAGLVEFAGVAGIPCGDQIFTVDFGTPPVAPVDVAADGSFSVSIVVPYTDNAVPIFTTEWTLEGVMHEDGVVSGSLQSVTSEGLGGWAVCDGTSTRSWRAGWVAP